MTFEYKSKLIINATVICDYIPGEPARSFENGLPLEPEIPASIEITKIIIENGQPIQDVLCEDFIEAFYHEAFVEFLSQFGE